MMAATKKTGLFLLLFGLIQISGGCIMEDRVVELVVNERVCVDFLENHATVSFVTPTTVNYEDEINKILDDNGVSRDRIVSARLVSASYGVTDFPDHDDWVITGAVTVEREDVTDGPDTLWTYGNISVSDALGERIPVTLNSSGVGVLNRALDDFIADGSPVLTFKVVNSGVTPPPSIDDPIQFLWKGCLVVGIVVETDVEVPDPF